jgi:hypothetical protein
MNLNYFTNIPFASNDPSIDQPNMQTNTNSISAWVDVDHYGFKNASNLGGLHTQVTMPVLGAIPARLLSTSGILYTKNVPVYTATPQSANTLFYTAGTSAKEYQITRTINNNTQFNLFSTQTAYQATANAEFKGGWTFLPGGMLLMYGTVTNLVAPFTVPVTVPFPIEFTVNPYSITATVTKRFNPVLSIDSVIQIVDGSVSTTNFQVVFGTSALVSGNLQVVSFSWMAIGT